MPRRDTQPPVRHSSNPKQVSAKIAHFSRNASPRRSFYHVFPKPSVRNRTYPFFFDAPIRTSLRSRALPSTQESDLQIPLSSHSCQNGEIAVVIARRAPCACVFYVFIDARNFAVDVDFDYSTPKQDGMETENERW